MNGSELVRACPPELLPQSHKTIQAAAVRTIPIPNYAHLIHPTLIDGANCLVSGRADDLDSVLQRAFHIPPTERLQIRDNVIAMYDTAIDPAG